MPSARIIRDALWHCLCPRVSFTGVFKAPLATYSKPLQEQSRRARDPLRRCITHSYPLAPPSQTSPIRPFHITGHQRLIHSDVQYDPAISRASQPHQHDGNLAKIYAQLNDQARTGQYQKVQKSVDLLIKDYGEAPNERLYEALILANTDCGSGSASEVARLLQDMAEEGVLPSSTVLHGALKALAVHPDYLLRNHVLDELRQRWFTLSLNGWHDVVVGLIRERQLEKALEVLEQRQKDGGMIHPWLYDILIYTLCSVEEYDEALRLLEHLVESGDLEISPTLWSHVLDSASQALHLPLTLFVFNMRVRTSYLNPSSGVCTNILSTAARHSDTHLATVIFGILSRRTGNPIQLHHYEALLETYIAAKDLRPALTLLTTMGPAGHSPTEACTRPIYTYIHHSPYLLAKAHKIIFLLRDEGRSIPIQAINVLIESYVHQRDLSAALELYKSMQTLSPNLAPNTATFNALFRGCARMARKDMAMFLASEMVALKVRPDALSYDRLLLVCLNTSGGLNDAWNYLEEMKAAGWRPRGGTTISFARKACEVSDARVWSLVDDGSGESLSIERVKSLVTEHWGGGKHAAKLEVQRFLDQGS